MQVTGAEVVHLRAALATPAGPAGVYNTQRETLLLRLTASDGTVGWGETYALPGTEALLRALATGLLGARLDRAWPRRPGMDAVGVSLAVAAIDIAWHDLLGRVLGVPAHTLLGGAIRRTVPVYASGFLYRKDQHPADVWPAEAEAALAAGFRALKVRIGGLPPSVELPLLRTLVQSLPEDVAVLVDAWGAYPPATAVRVGERLADIGIGWFEEPTDRGYPALTARLAVPVAGGEMGRTRDDFVRWIDERTYDVLQPDISICGGFGVGRFVAEMAALNGVACVPHTWNGAVMAAATLHLASTMPTAARIDDGAVLGTGPMLEYDTSENPLIRETVHNPIDVVDGYATVPDAPGLGVEVDEDAIARYRVD